MAEEQLRRTLTISQGNPVALVDSPFAMVAYGLLALVLITTLVLRLRRNKVDEVKVPA